MSITVVIADDHLVVRRGLRAVLEDQPDISVVGEAADGRAALTLVAALDPDLLVLDLVMPRLDGLQVLGELTSRGARTRVVVLSMHADDACVVAALQAGAMAYVVKDARACELVEAVRQASANRRFLSSQLPERREGGLGNRGTPPADAYDVLTAREREILHLAAQGLTNPEIGRRLAISRRTAETHRANLLRKLGLKGSRELMRYAKARHCRPLVRTASHDKVDAFLLGWRPS